MDEAYQLTQAMLTLSLTLALTLTLTLTLALSPKPIPNPSPNPNQVRFVDEDLSATPTAGPGAARVVRVPPPA